MPINPKLKEQLTRQISDEAYRNKLIATLEDAPAEVQNNWMAADDYTRQVNAFKTEQAAWKTKADQYYTDTTAKVQEWERSVQTATTELANAKARIAELETGGGHTRTPAEEDAVAKEVKALQTTIADLNTKLANVVTPDKLSAAYQDAVGFLGDQMLTISELQAKHQETFGKRLDKTQIGELITFANEQTKAKGHQVTLEEAYDMKNKAEMQRLHDERVANEAIEKFKSTNHVPTGAGPGGPGPVGKGPLEVRLDQERVRAAGGDGDKGFATWQEAAAAAGQELVKEGKY